MRRGDWTTGTTYKVPGYVQANLVVLPRPMAYDFLIYCQRNPAACPVIDITEPGDPESKSRCTDPHRRPRPHWRGLGEPDCGSARHVHPVESGRRLLGVRRDAATGRAGSQAASDDQSCSRACVHHRSQGRSNLSPMRRRVPESPMTGTVVTMAYYIATNDATNRSLTWSSSESRGVETERWDWPEPSHLRD